MRSVRLEMTAEKVLKSAAPLNSQVLFKGRSCVFIEHNGELYTLRITSNGKLILTK
ncbi:MAG: hypothetical protein CMD92_00710 [Gammaproteobacteria bacterium]|nr:hypothetical protein [Gammaproteobacteria bacterium]HBW82564.1 hemin uptake protein HemP [Gammaproteobacteria bacterium]